MKFDVSEAEIKAAKVPHDIFLLNMIGNHVLLFIVTVGMFAQHPWPIVAVPTISVATLIYTYWRGAKSPKIDPWYVKCHWAICLKRTKVFTIMLAVIAVLVLFGFIAYRFMGAPDILMKALSGVLILPSMVVILTLIIFESESLHRAGRGELPEWVMKLYPNPGVAEIEVEVPPAIAAERAQAERQAG